jgi:hypothetical protein
MEIPPTIDGVFLSLGLFENFDEAVKTRKAAEQKYFGDFAPGERDGNRYRRAA